MKSETKHKLALFGAAAVVAITAFALYAKENGIDLGIDPSKLGGFGLKALGGGKGAGGLPSGPGGNNLPPPPPTGDSPSFDPTVLPEPAPTDSTAPTFFAATAPTSTSSGFAATPIYDSGAGYGGGGFTYSPDGTPTAGGLVQLPSGFVDTPVDANTFTVAVNSSQWVSPNTAGVDQYTGPTGYQTDTGNQVYQAQSVWNPATQSYDALGDTGGPSNQLAYIPSDVPVYQVTGGGIVQVDAGTQLPGASGDPTGFVGYGLTAAPGDLGLPDGAQILQPLANSESQDNWNGAQGHNPNNQYDTN